MKTVFIINPVAGNGKAKKKWLRFRKTIGFPYEAVETETAGHATELVQELAETGEPVLLIGFGGDGTMRELVAGAAGAEHIMIGSVAAGSGNDFCRGFASFGTATEIEAFLLAPASRKQDACELEGDEHLLFVSSSGIGFDAEVADRVNRSVLKGVLNRIGFGKLAYFFMVALTLIRFQPFSLEVNDAEQSKQFEQVWLATVHNQPYFGGGMKISPASITDDGILEVTVVHGISRLKLLLVFGTVFSGSHLRFKEVTQWQSTAISFVTKRAVCRHVDGDAAGMAQPERAVFYKTGQHDWLLANNEQKEEFS